jgi:hypothetical protein
MLQAAADRLALTAAAMQTTVRNAKTAGATNITVSTQGIVASGRLRQAKN